MTVHAAALEHTFVMHVVLPRDYDVVADRVSGGVLKRRAEPVHGSRHVGGWHTDSTAARLMRAGRMQDACS